MGIVDEYNEARPKQLIKPIGIKIENTQGGNRMISKENVKPRQLYVT